MVNRRDLLKGGAAAVGAFAAGCADRPPGWPDDWRPAAPEEPEQSAPVTIAFIGDQGLNDTAREVLRLIKSEGADLVVHAGDFDYADNPSAWASMLDEELGEAFPYIAAIGNHDIYEWGGYRSVLEERAEGAEGLEYTGDIGLRSTYSYKGVMIVVVSPGVCDPDDEDMPEDPCRTVLEYDHEKYVADQLSGATAPWRICSWHTVHEDYQIGDKGTEADIELYEVCRAGGAIIATAHNHAYARTYPMSDFAEGMVASTSPPFTIRNGETFNVISAIGGESFYPVTGNAHDDRWAKTYSRVDAGHTFGAFFSVLRPDRTGECYFKNIDGTVVDGPFPIESAVTAARSPPGSPVQDARTD